MNITKDVIGDLIPLYVANECSADTRALVDEYLRQNPGQAEELRRIISVPNPAAPPSAVVLDEMRSLKKARCQVRFRSCLMGLAIFFSLAPFSVMHTGERTYWLFLESPRSAAIYGVIGVLCWIAYAALRKRAKSL